ncbi:hypothetical protein VZQ01_06240 [Myxococcus faecalis]|uniref:hypothetical protein n=1 Tax=Myxococcus faecalis TaxID=3115646 RepID=UPI003CE99D55
MRRVPWMGVSLLVAGVLMGCGGVESEAPAPADATQEQTLEPSCPSGYTSLYLWQCRRLAAHTAPCNYAGPGNYNVLHLYCESGSASYDAGPTSTYACGDCF